MAWCQPLLGCSMARCFRCSRAGRLYWAVSSAWCWPGLLPAILALFNPFLASHIDWPWFIASQVAFGVVAGIVVTKQSRMLTRENLAFLMRAGIVAPVITTPRGNR